MPLTYKNVTVTNPGNGTQALGLAGDLFNRAFSKFGSAAKSVSDQIETEKSDASAAQADTLINRINALGSAEDIQAYTPTVQEAAAGLQQKDRQRVIDTLGGAEKSLADRLAQRFNAQQAATARDEAPVIAALQERIALETNPDKLAALRQEATKLTDGSKVIGAIDARENQIYANQDASYNRTENQRNRELLAAQRNAGTQFGQFDPATGVKGMYDLNQQITEAANNLPNATASEKQKFIKENRDATGIGDGVVLQETLSLLKASAANNATPVSKEVFSDLVRSQRPDISTDELNKFIKSQESFFGTPETRAAKEEASLQARQIKSARLDDTVNEYIDPETITWFQPENREVIKGWVKSSVLDYNVPEASVNQLLRQYSNRGSSSDISESDFKAEVKTLILENLTAAQLKGMSEFEKSSLKAQFGITASDLTK